ncbi:OB-fold domain-containing protein [Saccharopolyspora sp. HNM0983]|uniref:OB-fold domain-containing protein n=1 Tax=Saccharopolyspora montiporae TaxID=2781240 RepID=A0A929BD63_9PSEU|nr:OB-fold domain-containing protein [Saccharopolyspora sp. HNM0983]MBE9375883.1 OB-fold domain-containing protein [Saccharopolyspora sp. HNM0983]
MAEIDPAGAPEVVFRDGLAEGELRYQRCRACSTAVFQPRVLCTGCGSDDLSWERSSGRGTVYSTTAVRGRGGAHNVALVDLDEGFRMMSRVDDIDPGSVGIGMRVAFTTVEDNGDPVAVFRKGSA